MRRRAIFVVPEEQRPHPGRAYRGRVYLQDSSDHGTIGKHVVVVIVPVARWAGGRGAFEDQIGHSCLQIRTSGGRLRRLSFRPIARPERLDEIRQPFRKFIAAGQREPAAPHVEIIRLASFGPSLFCQPPTFFGTAVALADFFTEVLEHGASPKNSGGSAIRYLSHRRLPKSSSRWTGPL